jgi:hypothetical protein
VFTLLPLLTGENRTHHGEILNQAATLAEQGKLMPLLSKQRFNVGGLEARVQAGSLGKVVIDIGR